MAPKHLLLKRNVPTQFLWNNLHKWDPKITTLPGLYLFSVGLLKPFGLLGNLTDVELCSVVNLRLINTIFSAGNIYLFYSITRLLNRHAEEDYVVLKSAALSVMPLLFFFNFLYYTDPGSLFFVLYAYYYHLRGSFSLSAILGMTSVIFRQTNIIWVFFMALCNLSRNTHKQIKLESKNSHTVWTVITRSLPIFIINAVISCWSHAIVGITAIAFVLWNGSIVVGDKTAHEACLNPPQIGYFACFALGLSMSHFASLGKIKQFLNSAWNYKLLTIVIAVAFVGLIYQFTLVHEYLLADNRHYTFYVWSRFFGRYPVGRYLLVPIYMYGLWVMDNSLSHMHWMIRTCLWFCVCAALIPQKLMEFRYFVVPYIIIRLHMKGESMKSIFLELCLYMAINFFTFYIFLYKPIFWPRIHEPQRIMW